MKIIVVNDEPMIADTLVDILNGEGYKAVAISSGRSAIKWARMIEPDVVISDVIMPEMNEWHRYGEGNSEDTPQLPDHPFFGAVRQPGSPGQGPRRRFSF
jgi:DNA-binding response OmpR family regulator